MKYSEYYYLRKPLELRYILNINKKIYYIKINLISHTYHNSYLNKSSIYIIIRTKIYKIKSLYLNI